MSWDGQDISGQQHTRVEFADIDLTEAKNNGTVFTECVFQRCRFNVSEHRDAAFVNCTFKSCSFFDTKFVECKFVGSIFERCTYDLMQITGGNWSHVSMPKADLGKAVLRGVRLREADFDGVRAVEGSIRDCDLSAASLLGTNFAGCDLRGSDLGALKFEDSDLRDAIITAEQATMLAVAMGLDVRAE